MLPGVFVFAIMPMLDMTVAGHKISAICYQWKNMNGEGIELFERCERELEREKRERKQNFCINFHISLIELQAPIYRRRIKKLC